MERFVSAIDSIVGAVTEVSAAVLVIAEIAILFAGVVSRYVLHQPILWSDELASILFLWLAMLGAVVALRSDERIRADAARFRAVLASAGYCREWKANYGPEPWVLLEKYSGGLG